jgi:hypothetical protein
MPAVPRPQRWAVAEKSKNGCLHGPYCSRVSKATKMSLVRKKFSHAKMLFHSCREG